MGVFVESFFPSACYVPREVLNSCQFPNCKRAGTVAWDVFVLLHVIFFFSFVFSNPTSASVVPQGKGSKFYVLLDSTFSQSSFDWLLWKPLSITKQLAKYWFCCLFFWSPCNCQFSLAFWPGVVKSKYYMTDYHDLLRVADCNATSCIFSVPRYLFLVLRVPHWRWHSCVLWGV